jgi:uncharacterized protein (DUF1015 family)
MAEVRPFRALRYDPAVADPALTIAPPYDVISPAQQAALYERDPHNIIRIEYGREQPGDSESSNKYTRAASDLRAWREQGVLALDAQPAIYVYHQQFAWAGESYERTAYFGAVRLEEWDKGIIKPHEHTLANPKADRLNLLRATRTQVSPVYSLYRPRGERIERVAGDPVIDCESDGQRHRVERATGAPVDAFAAMIANSDVYIADGHHRYETALAYRDEARARSSSWSGDEPENFVLMALTPYDDPGLLVLPTHRIVRLPSIPDDALARVSRQFDARPVDASDVSAALARLAEAGTRAPAFIAAGLPGGPHLLTLRDRAAIEALMPAAQLPAWKRLDVNVLQYGILEAVFGIDDATLKAGGVVAYEQDAASAIDSVRGGDAQLAFLLNATPIAQVAAVADAGGRMPQKSTYFQPKLPTGLVLRPLD